MLALFFIFFFFNDTATTEIYTLSLHDALPISPSSETSHRKPFLTPSMFTSSTATSAPRPAMIPAAAAPMPEAPPVTTAVRPAKSLTPSPPPLRGIGTLRRLRYFDDLRRLGDAVNADGSLRKLRSLIPPLWTV